jgi:hypothetical protein
MVTCSVRMARGRRKGSDGVIIEDVCALRGLRVPHGLARLHHSDLPAEVAGRVYRADWPPDRQGSVEWAYRTVSKSDWPLPNNLIPLMPVDRRSLACVLATPAHDEQPALHEGAVFCWHIDVRKREHQAKLLDTSVESYVESIVEEYRARKLGLDRMLDEIGPAYKLQYLEAERSPRDFVLRPIRLACQNVLVGLAAFAHDSSIDGMSVVAWQTCEVPHVGTHEANRALAALMLCDAFQSGGTMEIRFDRPVRLRASGLSPKSLMDVEIDVTYQGHPEGRVPASLRRYGRTIGIELGAVDPAAITPGEARELFVAVTQMPSKLAARVHKAVDGGIATPERLCFTLLAQVWREIELDFMLAVSDRTGSIISGGANWKHRVARQAESEVARAALVIGMLYRRLDSLDNAGSTTDARVTEDNRVGVRWDVLPDVGAIEFSRLRPEPLPWLDTLSQGRAKLFTDDALTVLPRSAVSREAVETAQQIGGERSVAIVIPRDGAGDAATLAAQGIGLLRCPDRLGELDQEIERKLLAARIARV